MARLSWPGWLVIYWDRFSRTGSWTPDMVDHPSTNRARRRVASLITSTMPNHYNHVEDNCRIFNECRVFIAEVWWLRKLWNYVTVYDQWPLHWTIHGRDLSCAHRLSQVLLHLIEQRVIPVIISRRQRKKNEDIRLDLNQMNRHWYRRYRVTDCSGLMLIIIII